MSVQPDEVIRLWQDGPPTKIEGVGPEAEYRAPVGVAKNATMLRNVSEPTLSVYRPAKQASSVIRPLPQWNSKGRGTGRPPDPLLLAMPTVSHCSVGRRPPAVAPARPGGGAPSRFSTQTAGRNRAIRRRLPPRHRLGGRQR